ncbi:class I SAM-dependent methyltransferase [Candidatus Pacearchaeota archaeon]|nr:class I SAM-dependent methyltransferase [Candidatus Pacearchaeota archaeon]
MGKFDTFIQTRILRPIRLKAILKILCKIHPGTIIDLGCMDDYLLKRLPKKFDYVGYDENPLCKNEKIIKGKVEDLTKNKKFDVVLCTEVLEHVDDPVEVMRNLKKLSKRFILISVPNEPFFSLARLFIPAKEHLWTIYPWALEKHFGKPIFKRKACFQRTHIALWDLKNSNKNIS